MLFHDRAIIDGPARITPEGHFVARARVARANNIQDYLSTELGLPPKADGSPYRIFRPEGSIFAKDSLATAVRRPIVVDHPSGDVTDENRDRLSVGDTGGEILRDGETMVVPIVVTAKDAVARIQTTHREFSWGYDAQLDMTPGTFNDQAYDGSITPPLYNHLAMCRRARGGSDLRVTDSLTIIDERPAHLRDQEKQTMKIKIGDAEVDATNGEAVSVAVGSLNTKLADAEGKVGTLTAEVATLTTSVQAKDGEIAALNQKLKDAEVTPAKLQQLADARAVVVTMAKAIAPALVTDGKTDAEIRKDAVTAKLGDAAKDMSDATIEGAFIGLTKDVKVGDAAPTIPSLGGVPVNIGDASTRAASAYDKMVADLRGETAKA